MGRTIKELFQQADADESGILSKEEFTKLMGKAQKEKSLRVVLNPQAIDNPYELGEDAPQGSTQAAQGPVSVDEAWDQLRKVPIPDSDMLGVNFSSFESWWKQRSGVVEPDIPVLPEVRPLASVALRLGSGPDSAAVRAVHGAAHSREGASQQILERGARQPEGEGWQAGRKPAIR